MPLKLREAAQRVAEFIAVCGGREFKFCPKLIMGSLKRIVEIRKNSYGMFRGRPKGGEREGSEREGSGLMSQEQKWTKSTKAVNHANRFLVH